MVNARVLTMKRSQPRAEAVAVCGERIAAVGSNAFVRSMISKETQVIDCQGLSLLPGFNDAHCHLAGMARRLMDLDCSPERASSIAELQTLVRSWSEPLPPGRWVRGFGYDDLSLAERRLPDRHDLDIAAPDRPVWLEHRSGHASALNTPALEMAGIRRDTLDPPGGVIDRCPSTGEPTGILYEMQPFLRQRLGNIRSPREFEKGMRSLNESLLSYGITSVQDAGADNAPERRRTFESLQSSGLLSCRITVFAGANRLDEWISSGLWFESGDNRLRVGHAKIMLTLTSGALNPSYQELESVVTYAHGRGFPVAVHCVEEEAIAATAAVLSANNSPGLVDRIEHCAEGTPSVINTVKRSGASVVTQPGFIFHNGKSYRENVDARLIPHLYPAAALGRARISTAFGSDGPVIDPNPWPAIYSAVTRHASDGLPLNPGGNDAQSIGVAKALRMYTVAAAEVEGMSAEKGSIASGNLADMVLVDKDPLAIAPGGLPDIEAVMTIVGGEVAWGKI